jgi:hypothetical protein
VRVALVDPDREARDGRGLGPLRLLRLLPAAAGGQGEGET